MNRKSFVNEIAETVVVKTKAPDLEAFVEFLQTKVDGDTHKRITQEGRFLEYGMAPQRFLLSVTGENTVLFSFFLDCDPTFSAVIFTLAREYFGETAFLADSFLYRVDGAICMAREQDFPLVYIDYLKSVLKRARGVSDGTKRTTTLN